MSQTITLADVDSYEDTEEQFASSVVGSHHHEDDEQELASGTLAAARERYSSFRPATSQQDLLPSTNSDAAESWKDEVASRLQNYKARRRSSMGQASLNFNFESTAGNHVFLRPEREPEPEPAPVYHDPEPSQPYYSNNCATAPAYHDSYESSSFETLIEPMDQPTSEIQSSFVEFTEPEVKPAFVSEPAKLIVFPRPPMMQEPPRDQLADPVFDTPRILEVPEMMDTMAIPLADITLQPDPLDDPCVPYIEPITELPFRVAPVSQRVFAEMMDTLLVVVATGIFTMILARMDASVLMHDKRAFMTLLLMVPAALWSIYKYLFLVHSGITPGMQLAQLRLVDFDGQCPHSTPRRYRALSMLVSIFPLGLGLLWSFVDPDRLCWHDRISKTYMTAR